MQSRWNDAEAQEFITRYAPKGVNADLAVRIYTTRLLGSDPRLVLHGGGNTSVKTMMKDALGDDVEVLCVKGSGWDMGAIEPQGLPAVRLAPLRRLRALDKLSDEDMVNFQRINLLDSTAPNPSVETLLHAFLPHKFIDHTHSTAVLALTDQPDGEAMVREVYGDRVAYVPYTIPGFALAKSVADVFDTNPKVEGLVLLQHGIFTVGETAQQAYSRMIEIVSMAEARLGQGCRHRCRHSRERHRRDWRRRSDRRISLHQRVRHVRSRILVAGTGQAGQVQRESAGAAGGGDHRRRLGYRRGHGAGVCRARRGGSDPGPRPGRGQSRGQKDRRQGAGTGLRRHRSRQRRPGLRPGGRGFRRRGHRGVERGRGLAGHHRHRR